MATLTAEDEGKVLVDTEGEELGVVTGVESNTAWVDPEPGLAHATLAAFGWADKDEEDYTVLGEAVATVTEEEVRLERDV